MPKNARTDIQIVDGQHRTLGFHLAWEELGKEIEQARALRASAERQGDVAVASAHEKTLNRLLQRRETLSNERVSVQILIVESPDIARRVFVDINDNAKGITGAVRARFDDRKVVSRALNIVLTTNALLAGRVDIDQDRVSGSSQYLLGAKHVGDILRSLAVGNGNLTKRVENELVDTVLASDFDQFIDGLMDAFPTLLDVESGVMTPAELRSDHLIGSNVILRAFAAAWYDLRQARWSPREITLAFTAFEPFMAAPVFPSRKDSWYLTGVFPTRRQGAASPTSRLQDFKTLTTFIVNSAIRSTDANWYRAPIADEDLLLAD